MDCLPIEIEDRIEVVVTRAWTLLLTITIGIFVGVICTLSVYFIKVKINRIGKCSCCGFCCTCLAASKDDRECQDSWISLESWVVVPKEIGEIEYGKVTKYEEHSATHINRPMSNESTRTKETDQAHLGSDTESTQNEYDEQQDKILDIGKPYSTLAEILMQSNSDMISQLLLEEEGKSVLRLESSFVQQRADLFLLMVEKITTEIVEADNADLVWKQRLVAYCKSSFTRVQKRDRSNSISHLAISGTECPETLVKSKLSQMTIQLFEYMRLTFKENTNLAHMEVENILSDFQSSWNQFEKIQSELYIETLKEMDKVFRQREEIVTILDQNNAEIMDEIKNHLTTQVKGIQQLMVDDVISAVSITGKDGVVTKLKKTWGEALEKYDKELQARKQDMLTEAEGHIRSERNQIKESCENSLHSISSSLNGDTSTKSFTESHFEIIATEARNNVRMDKMETQLVATEMASLLETIGTTYCTHAIHGEKRIYSHILHEVGERDTMLPELILDHQKTLKNLQTNLRIKQKLHKSKIQDILTQTTTGEDSGATSFIADEINSQHEAVKNVIDKQADLTPMECQSLQAQCTAQLKTLEFQLEMSQLRQKIKMKQESKRQQAVATQDLKLLANNEMQWDSSISSMVKLQNKKEAIQQQHAELMQHMKRAIQNEIRSAIKLQQLLFQQQIEKFRRGHERNTSETNMAPSDFLKDKIQDKLASESEKTLGERVLYQHQISREVITDKIEKTKMRQEQVLQQKLQARKLLDKGEISSTNIECRPRNIKRVVANTLVGLLHEVRQKRMKSQLDEELLQERLKVVQTMKRKCEVHYKLEIKQRETEMTVKLASLLNITRAQLEREL